MSTVARPDLTAGVGFPMPSRAGLLGQFLPLGKGSLWSTHGGT
jgi:hypothetical protein